MVTVCVRQSGSEIQLITIYGHAESGPKGQDLVCAGVSSIGIGMLNALDQMTPDCCCLQLDKGIRVEVLQTNETVQTILQTVIIQLQTMEEQYSKFIQIVKQEV